MYGIPNCGSVKKAKQFFEDNDLAYDFHDFKKEGITKTALSGWCKKVGWEKLVNKKGTTWRGLLPEVQSSVSNQTNAIGLMFDNNSVIKRPVISYGDELLVGYDQDIFENNFLNIKTKK